MAREFANTAGSPNIDYINYSVIPAVAGLATCSLVMRIAGDSDCPNFGTAFSIDDVGSANFVGVFREGVGANIGWAFRNASAAPRQHCPFTFDGTMRSLVITYDGGATPKTVAYVDGVSKTITSVGSLPTTIGSGQTVCGFGMLAGFRFNGRIADCGVYNRVITPAEALIHAAGYSCRNFQRGLIFYAPLIRDAHDIAGGGAPTITGTTVSAHPRIYA